MTARFAIWLLVAAVIALAVPGVAAADVFNVNTTADHDDKLCTVADCTLREAVQQGGGDDTINVPSGNYVLTMSTELVLSADTIAGAGARTTFIDGGDKTRVLRVAGEGTSRVSGVTIRNGNGASTTSNGNGGGILQNANLILTNVTVSDNSASGIAGGGGIAVATGTLQLVNSTISGNLASTGRGASGGGLLVGAGAAALVGNTTFSGNVARDTSTAGDLNSQGGAIATAGTLASFFVTIAGNTARNGGGLWQAGAGAAGPPATTTMNNTIFGANTGGACAGPGIGAAGVITSHHDIVIDGSCQLTGEADQQDVNPLIGPLQNNGGPTDTRALAVNSPAINAAGSCPTTDQRGVARPGGSTCDIGAFEFIPPTLRVTTTVVNDNGGTKVAGDFLVHVKQGATEAPKSPQNGNASGFTFTLTPGSYTVSIDGLPGYTGAISGDCDGKGAVTVAENQAKACTITLNDVAPALTVITNVTNDNGGTKVAADFKAHVRSGATDVTGSPQNGSATGTVYTLNAGNYTVSGDALPGYTLSVSAGCAPVALAVGSPTTCTITANDVAPTLTVITSVTNDAGGTKVPADFKAHVRSRGVDVAGSPQNGSATGTVYTLNAGTYAVSADLVPGYALSVSEGCGAVVLVVGSPKTCTISADDVTSSLTVVTAVVNDDGGTKDASGFSAHVMSAGADVVGSPAPGNATTGTTYSLAADDYTVSADAVPGYTTSMSGDCASNGTITLANGQAGTCTITANDVAPTLTVVKQVVNDNGGTRAPADFSVHVTRAGAEVAGSPQPGTASGRTYTLAVGTYAVSEDAVAGYLGTISGACAPDGTVTLKEGDTQTCTITNDDLAQVGSQQLAAPVAGKAVNLLPKTGTVKIKLPGTSTFVLLEEGRQIPVGTIVDALKGRVTLVAAADKNGGTATADFYGGIFKLGQTSGATPITTLKLVEKLSCKKSGKASASAKKKKKRRLWGDGKGKFRTEGSYSSATVRGTKWLVEDSCTSTLTKVARGSVTVRDLVKKKNVIVKAGKKYVARARG